MKLCTSNTNERNKLANLETALLAAIRKQHNSLDFVEFAWAWRYHTHTLWTPATAKGERAL